MSDQRLRDLQRRWESTGSLDDEAAFLRERLRLIEQGVARPARRSSYVNEGDDWTVDGQKILSPENVALLRTEEERGDDAFVVEHRYYRGGCAPSRLVLETVDELVEYVRAHARAGDSLWVWSYSKLCRDDDALVHGKVEDSEGRVPRGGAY